MESMDLLKEAESIYRKLGNKTGLQTCLNCQGEILYTHGDRSGAIDILKKLEQALGSWEAVRSCQIRCSIKRKFFLNVVIWVTVDEAMDLLKEQERLSRVLGIKQHISSSLGLQGWILSIQGDLERAMLLYKEKEGLCREIGFKDGLQDCLCNQGSIYLQRGDLDRAMALYKEQEGLLSGYRK